MKLINILKKSSAESKMPPTRQVVLIFGQVALLMFLWKGYEYAKKLIFSQKYPQDTLFNTSSSAIKAKKQFIDSLQKRYTFTPKRQVDTFFQLAPSIDIKDDKSPPTFLLYPQNRIEVLENFFSALQELENGAKKHYRVLYFADSQIEGDRITATLRTALQEKFGGCGVGLQGLTNTNNIKLSVYQENDERLKSYFVLGKLLPEPHFTYGILGRTYLYESKDTTGYTIFRRSEKANPLAQKVENVKVLFRNKQTDTFLEVWQESDKILQKKFEKSTQLQCVSIPLPNEFSILKLVWSSSYSPEMYAVGLDCNYGITVDNIPIRGSAGLEFTKMDSEVLKNQAIYLNPCLVVLQFGLNVTMHTNDFSFYEKKMLKQIQFLKKCIPQASFVIVGISDRAYKTSLGYQTYPAVETLRNTQRKLAMQTGCAFWDLYEAMGGKNSIALWVEKGLASKDYTHLLPKGTEIIGNMFFEALWKDFMLYKRMRSAK